MPGEAADYLKENYPRNLMVKLSSIAEGEAIAFSRSQLRQKMSDFDEDDSYADNDIKKSALSAFFLSESSCCSEFCFDAL